MIDRYYIDSYGIEDIDPKGKWVHYTDHEQALAEKDKEIEYLQGCRTSAAAMDAQRAIEYQQLMGQAMRLSKALQEVKTIAFLIGNDVRLQPCRDMGIIAAKALAEYEEAFLKEREINGSH